MKSIKKNEFENWGAVKHAIQSVTEINIKAVIKNVKVDYIIAYVLLVITMYCDQN